MVPFPWEAGWSSSGQKAGHCGGDSNTEVMGDRIWNGKERKRHIPDFMLVLRTPGYKGTRVKCGQFGT